MEQSEIESRMQELARELHYKWHDLRWLSEAMCAQKLDNGNYRNDALATLGDTLLKCILTEYFYDRGYTKGEITDAKKPYESNTALKRAFDELHLYRYAYKDSGFSADVEAYDHVSNSIHNQYIEAIIGAMYKDKGFDSTKKWVLRFLKNHMHLE